MPIGTSFYTGASMQAYEDEARYRAQAMQQRAMAQMQGLAGMSDSYMSQAQWMGSRGAARGLETAPRTESKPKTIREELQRDTDEWLKDVNL